MNCLLRFNTFDTNQSVIVGTEHTLGFYYVHNPTASVHLLAYVYVEISLSRKLNA